MSIVLLIGCFVLTNAAFEIGVAIIEFYSRYHIICDFFQCYVPIHLQVIFFFEVAYQYVRSIEVELQIARLQYQIMDSLLLHLNVSP